MKKLIAMIISGFFWSIFAVGGDTGDLKFWKEKFPHLQFTDGFAVFNFNFEWFIVNSIFGFRNLKGSETYTFFISEFIEKTLAFYERNFNLKNADKIDCIEFMKIVLSTIKVSIEASKANNPLNRDDCICIPINANGFEFSIVMDYDVGKNIMDNCSQFFNELSSKVVKSPTGDL